MSATLRHICEVCGKDEILTADEAYERGWDYPPKMGTFGIVSPRTCPDCPVTATVWYALVVDHIGMDMITPEQRLTLERIIGEPETVIAS